MGDSILSTDSGISGTTHSLGDTAGAVGNAVRLTLSIPFGVSPRRIIFGDLMGSMASELVGASPGITLGLG